MVICYYTLVQTHKLCTFKNNLRYGLSIAMIFCYSIDLSIVKHAFLLENNSFLFFSCICFWTTNSGAQSLFPFIQRDEEESRELNPDKLHAMQASYLLYARENSVRGTLDAKL